ncbi:hypothetical protein [Agromyces sp. Leaf222]|uniref:hypothetical protein n=1 Tax=Agromyces sp. Leaf222 TaxID=1735688 RepID=UPI0006F7DE02|nr:hypothetical protein [Agromyces sp. Leaf222]KQM82495.1 hypothetical protein ASE68_03715 [Agromyces sp. Leaf222]
MDVTDWLLESDPSVRWQVLRDLTGEPAEAVAAERARVAVEGDGARLLDLQTTDGYWGGEEYGQNGDRRSVMWTLQALRFFGVDPDAAAVRTAIARVRDGVEFRGFDERLSFFDGEVEACVNGGVLAASAYFGVLGDGADRMIGLLLDGQLDDGGWNCEPPEESSRSSFDSTLCVLEGLLAYELAVGEATDAAVIEARHRGEEYLLERNLYRRKSTGGIVRERYENFIFPPYWVYDVLRSLDHFRAAGLAAGTAPDPRLAPAVDLLLEHRGADGRWNAGDPWNGAVFFAIDAPAGSPSPWNTLRALRVLEWARPGGGDRPTTA